MKTAAGIVFGFALLPSFLAFFAAYMWAWHLLGVSTRDVATGMAVAFATMVVGAAVLIRALGN